MKTNLRTLRGTRIVEVTDIQYYDGDKHRIAFIWGLTDRGTELQFKPESLFPRDERDRVIKEMGEG